MIDFLLFIAGLQMMILLLAAGYRFIDLWYRIGDFWFSLIARLTLLVLADVAVVTWLADPLEAAFIWGQACYLMFHISIFWLARMGLWMLERSR